MKSENQKNRGQVRGYLFERILCILLEKNGLVRVQPDRFNKTRVRRVRENFIELKGRGGWHTIDCPFDYQDAVPFLYPLRLIGEVRYHQATVTKDAIRNLIGVLQDIKENYFIDDSLTAEMVRERRLEIGVFFAVNGFQAEAERLAYSHGIRTVSYKNNPLIQEIKDVIDVLESDYISYEVFAQKKTRFFLRDFEQLMQGELDGAELVERYEFLPEAKVWFERLYQAVKKIQSSVLASTNTGMVFHLLGEAGFPEEVFAGTDTAAGHICYESLQEDHQMACYLELDGDAQKRKFYFTLPEGLHDQAVYGLGISHTDPEEDGDRTERMLHINTKMGGIRRSLTVILGEDQAEIVKFF